MVNGWRCGQTSDDHRRLCVRSVILVLAALLVVSRLGRVEVPRISLVRGHIRSAPTRDFALLALRFRKLLERRRSLGVPVGERLAQRVEESELRRVRGRALGEDEIEERCAGVRAKSCRSDTP